MINEFKIYSKAIADQVLQVQGVYTQTPVPVIYYPGHRGFSYIQEHFQSQNKRLTLPIIAFNMSDYTRDFTQVWYYPHVYVRRCDNIDKIMVAKPPVFMKFTYIVNLWTMGREEKDYITKQIILKFDPHVTVIDVDLGDYGKKKLALLLEDVSDASSLEPNEDTPVYRGTFNMSLVAPIHHPIRLEEMVKETVIDWEIRE